MRVTVGNLKGGVAKTTTAVHLACGLAADGSRVLLVDADPQASSALDWSAAAGEAWPDRIVVVPWHGRDLAKRVAAVADDYGHVVIDTGGENDSVLGSALMVTDEFVIPVTPSAIELRRLPATFGLAARVDAVSPIIARVLLVKTQTGTINLRDARILLEELDLPSMAAEIGLRQRYINAFGTCPDDVGEYADVLAELTAQDDTQEAAAR